MVHLEVPERYIEELQELAQRDARPVQEVVSAAMDAYLSFRFTEATLSPMQLEHLKQSLDQAQRSDLVPEEAVEAFFDDWEKEAAAR